MIRFGLLGGKWGPVPSTFFLVLGGSCFAAALLVVFSALGTGVPVVGSVEAVALTVAGGALLSIGLYRRRHPPRLPSEPWAREQLLP